MAIFAFDHGEPCGADAATSGLKSGAPREAVCGRAMICRHCRVPTTCLSLTANRDFLHDPSFAFQFSGICARRFRRVSHPRACASRVKRIAEKQSELRELE